MIDSLPGGAALRGARPLAAVRRAAPWLWLGGSTLILAGERYAGSEALRWLLDGSGAVLALLVLVACAGRPPSAEAGQNPAGASSRQPRHSPSARPRAVGCQAGAPTPAPTRFAVGGSLGFYGLAALGLLLYPLTTGTVVDRLGFDDDGARSWRAVWTVVWLLAWWVGSAAAVGGDWTRYRSGGDLEPRRVRSATAAGLSLALAVAWVFAVNYTAGEHDRLWEWSARSRARVSEATLELVGALREPVEVVAFFPPANQVLRRIEPFLDEVAAAGPVDVAVLDQALEPTRAAELGARENGALFLLRGGDQRRIELDVDYERAKRSLGSLDREFQEALLEIGRERRTLYVTAGHGERGEYANDAGEPGLRNTHGILRALNVSTRNLPVADLIQDLPPDAGVVAALGPARRFLPEEVDSLRRFWTRGGSVLLLLEPGVDVGLEPLLQEMAVRRLEGTVANDRYHLRRDGGASDRRLVLTNRFGSHTTTSDLSRAASRIGLVLEGAAGLEGVAGGPARSTVLVRPMTGSWLELDGDFERDREAETDAIEALAMASTRPVEGAGEGGESRGVVIGDVDALNDDYVHVTGPGAMSANAKLLLDAYVWLAREDEAAVASVPGDDDPVLQRTRGESIRWFLGTVFGVPALVLAAGFGYVRRRRSGGRRQAAGDGS